MRGVERPQILEAVLTEPVAGEEGGRFVVQGSIARTEYGMVADRALVSNDIRLMIRVTLGRVAGERG